jgi:hypothetical protein
LFFSDAIIAQQETLCNDYVNSYVLNVPSDTDVNTRLNEFDGVDFDKKCFENNQLYTCVNSDVGIPHSHKSADNNIISGVKSSLVLDNDSYLNSHRVFQQEFIPGQSTGPEVCLYSDCSPFNHVSCFSNDSLFVNSVEHNDQSGHVCLNNNANKLCYPPHMCTSNANNIQLEGFTGSQLPFPPIDADVSVHFIDNGVGTSLDLDCNYNLNAVNTINIVEFNLIDDINSFDEFNIDDYLSSTGKLDHVYKCHVYCCQFCIYIKNSFLHSTLGFIPLAQLPFSSNHGEGGGHSNNYF